MARLAITLALLLSASLFAQNAKAEDAEEIAVKIPEIAGEFRRHPGGVVAAGDEIGLLVQAGDKHPVVSPFTGQLMRMLAMPGERIREHQPVAWLTITDG